MWNFSPERFIEEVYKAVLGRTADRYGHEIWTQIIVDGKDPTIAVTGLMESDEYRVLRESASVGAGSSSAPVRIARPGYDFSISVHARNDFYISSIIKERKVWEPFMTGVVEKILAQCEEFYDIGANIGWFSLVAGKILSGRGTVHSFEPAPDNAAVLTQNVIQNALTNVRVVPCALGRATETGRIYFSGNNKGDHRVYASGEVRNNIPVGVTLLDGYFDHDRESTILIKIDTQGSEADVIAGMPRVLADRRRDIVLILALWPAGLKRNGDTAAQLIEILRQADFQCLAFKEDSLVAIAWEEAARYAADGPTIAAEKSIDLLLYREGSPALGTVRAFVETAGRRAPVAIDEPDGFGEGAVPSAEDRTEQDIERSPRRYRRPFAADAESVVIHDRHGSACSIEYPPFRLDESVFVIGLHKAGSVLLNELIEAVCAEIGKCTVSIPSFLFNSGIQEGDISFADFEKLDRPGYIYNGFRAAYIPDQMPSYRQAKKLLLVRDPRDVAVSYYFSTLYSHPLPGDGPLKTDFEAKRRKLSEQDINALIINGGMDFLFHSQNEFSSRKHLIKNLTLFRYEDIIFRKMEWLSQILEWLRVDLEPQTAAAIVEQFDVFPDKEDPGAHIRQVTPGNYKSYLSTEATKYIESFCSSFFDAFDYRKDFH